MTQQLNHELVKHHVLKANSQQKPLYIIVIATKPCYIKLRSLIIDLSLSDVPFIVVESGQHYSSELVNFKYEGRFSQLISVVFANAEEGLNKSTGILKAVEFLAGLLREYGLKEQAIPVVSGDTITAALFPQFWYFQTTIRSIHVEAGLRSFKPVMAPDFENITAMRSQQTGAWEQEPNFPFPEGKCTRTASVYSQLLFAPVQLNRDILLSEGYNEALISLSGSLSADAVESSLEINKVKPLSVFEKYEFLQHIKWIRVDMHRRENMKEPYLRALFSAMVKYVAQGGHILLVVSRMLDRHMDAFDLRGMLADAAATGRLRIMDIWPDYSDVIELISSPACQGVITDSGGLQEETNILGIPCFTLRNNTDRMETVIHANTNLLLPPGNEAAIFRALCVLRSGQFFGQAGTPRAASLYGNRVSQKISSRLASFIPETADFNW